MLLLLLLLLQDVGFVTVDQMYMLAKPGVDMSTLLSSSSGSDAGKSEEPHVSPAKN